MPKNELVVDMEQAEAKHNAAIVAFEQGYQSASSAVLEFITSTDTKESGSLLAAINTARDKWIAVDRARQNLGSARSAWELARNVAVTEREQAVNALRDIEARLAQTETAIKDLEVDITSPQGARTFTTVKEGGKW